MRRIAISDIHGCIDEFKRLLEKVRYEEGSDRLILLGDYVDRGPSSKDVIEFVMSLKGDVHALGGNHDDWFVDWVDTWDGSMDGYLSSNIGGIQTVQSFCPAFDPRSPYSKTWARQSIRERYEEHLSFLRKLPNHYEDEQFIYVHAGINPFLDDWRKTNEGDFKMIRDPFLSHPHEQDKTVVFGHTPTRSLHNDRRNNSIWFGDRKIGIDGGCVFEGRLNALVIEGDSFNEAFVLHHSLQSNP